MVPQEPFLFRGSVADNIRYGNPGASPEQILLAARQADTHEFIMRMPLAYETQLGEGGCGLSGGEKQRLSIARALVFDPAILILDEATASVDAESERAICEAIRRFSRRRTTIVIAHRLSTLRDADRLLVFDQGRLIEQGSHEQLLARPGLYSALASLQGNLRETRRRMESVLGGSSSGGTEAALAELSGQPALAEAFSADARLPRNGRDFRVPGREEDDHLAWLDPEEDAIEIDEQGMLRVTRGGRKSAPAQAVRAFPASHDRALIALRARDASGREHEVGMIRRLDEWPPAARRAVEQSLGRRYLIRRICEVRQVRTSGRQLVLSVSTDSGPARIQLEKPGQGFQPFGPRGLLLVDGQGNYFVVPDRGALPKRQQRVLALYFGD
jgi:ABC-type multidrug transport system ATPase subunit